MFNARRHRLGEHPMMFPMDRFEAVDIDEEFELVIAESLMARRIAAQR